MSLNITVPLVLSAAVTALTMIAHFKFWIPEHKAFGLYSVGLAAAAVHCLLYGNQTWAIVCVVLTASTAALWLHHGGRDDIRRRIKSRETGPS